MFISHTRAHGAGNPREPWSFGEKAERIFQKFDNLRYRLMPYIYSQAYTYSREGLPMMQHLLIDFPHDRWPPYIEDEWMFGESLLVAPVLEKGTHREVYLPEGNWYDFWMKKVIAGGRYMVVEAPLDTIPLYIRGGAMLPFGPELDHPIMNRSPRTTANLGREGFICRCLAQATKHLSRRYSSIGSEQKI